MSKINPRIYQPVLFEPTDLALSHHLSTTLRSKVVGFLFDKQEYSTAHALLLTSKAWYNVTINHPLLWMANILLQLQKAPTLEDADQASFAGVNNFYVNSALPADAVALIKRLDPSSRGLNRLLSLSSDCRCKPSKR